MRKLIVVNIMSLDGYYEAPDKNVMPLFAFRDAYPEDDSFDAYNAVRLRAAERTGPTPSHMRPPARSTG